MYKRKYFISPVGACLVYQAVLEKPDRPPLPGPSKTRQARCKAGTVVFSPAWDINTDPLTDCTDSGTH